MGKYRSKILYHTFILSSILGCRWPRKQFLLSITSRAMPEQQDTLLPPGIGYLPWYQDNCAFHTALAIAVSIPEVKEAVDHSATMGGNNFQSLFKDLINWMYSEGRSSKVPYDTSALRACQPSWNNGKSQCAGSVLLDLIDMISRDFKHPIHHSVTLGYKESNLNLPPDGSNLTKKSSFVRTLKTQAQAMAHDGNLGVAPYTWSWLSTLFFTKEWFLSYCSTARVLTTRLHYEIVCDTESLSEPMPLTSGCVSRCLSAAGLCASLAKLRPISRYIFVSPTYVPNSRLTLKEHNPSTHAPKGYAVHALAIRVNKCHIIACVYNTTAGTFYLLDDLNRIIQPITLEELLKTYGEAELALTIYRHTNPSSIPMMTAEACSKIIPK